MNQESNKSFEEWAVVDVMGHQRYVGHVTEQVIAGAGFVRVDVPAADGSIAFSKLIGTASIYAISPVSEEIARTMASRSHQTPISRYDIPVLTSAPHDDDDPRWGD